jgi:hypothetical protein
MIAETRREMLGGGGGGTKADGDCVCSATGVSGTASPESWNVIRAVRRTISKPFLSSMSKLQMLNRISAHNYSAEASDYAPVKVIVKDLNLGVLNLPTLLLRDRDENWGVRFANEEALLSFPLELVSVVGNGVYTSHFPKESRDLLFPFERPPE